ncbi:MAG TPA: YdcF family protein [Puia sp.]|nr:YdcF family protein [Puia sp.]
MQHQRYLLLVMLGFVLIRPAAAQPGAGYRKEYKFLHSANRVADKNFYLITVLDQTPALRSILSKEQRLLAIGEQRSVLLKQHATDSCAWPGSLLDSFRFSDSDSREITALLQALYNNHRSLFDKMIDQHLRPSGYYQRFIAQSNEDLLVHAWGQYVTGINYIIDQFGLGKKLRYPRIDSANYPVDSRYYRTALKDMFAYLSEKMDTKPAFYAPSLAVALQLMDLNDRDEPARFEPMEAGENKKAVLAIKTTNWSKYSYATILIPGNGPELTSTPISPINKMHCAIAASRYQKGWAPFIIVSGGYCYPFRGPYCEAIEMKKYLMGKFAIPEAAILIDPFARHTTTNIRNADRLMIRYGIPLTRPSVFVTTKSQTNYANDALFDLRNLHELGYLPYKGKNRISLHDIEFYPVMESLHMDPEDPLDP